MINPTIIIGRECWIYPNYSQGFAQNCSIISRTSGEADMNNQKRILKLGHVALLLMFFLLIIGSTQSITIYADPPAQIEGEWIQSLDGRWWYRHTDGSYTSDGWEYINGYWYHFDSDGWMQTGWLQVNSTWYYLSSSGAMVTSWEYINSNWYYFSSSGAMCTGWRYINGSWYYFNDSGAMRTDPLYSSSRYYTFFSSGQLKLTRIMITRQEQQESEWCWAACLAMVGPYNTNYTTTQWDVVVSVLGYPLNLPIHVDVTAGALSIASNGTKWGSVVGINDFSYSDAVAETDGNRLIIIRMGWNSGGGHFVVGAGYDKEGNKIYIIDPAGGCSNDYFNYYQLITGRKIHSGTGSWTHTVTYEVLQD